MKTSRFLKQRGSVINLFQCLYDFSVTSSCDISMNHYVCMLYLFIFYLGKDDHTYNYNLQLYYRLVLYFIMINVYILF